MHWRQWRRLRGRRAGDAILRAAECASQAQSPSAVQGGLPCFGRLDGEAAASASCTALSLVSLASAVTLRMLSSAVPLSTSIKPACSDAYHAATRSPLVHAGLPLA